MAKIPRIKWEPVNSVHVEILDAQHRKLFDTVNHLIDVFESGSGDYFSEINELVDYLSIHFHEEQVVMMNAKYPGFLKHSKVHQKFIEKVDEFLQAYQEGKEDLGFNMIVFLKDWVNGHTTTMDMQYAAYLAKNAAKPH